MQDDKNLGQPSILKLIDNSEIGEYADFPINIVKFKKGQTPDPTDDNSLWWISYDENNVGSFNYNKDKCTWTEKAQLFVGQDLSPRPAYLIDLEDMSFSTEEAFDTVEGVNGAAFSGIGCQVYFNSYSGPGESSTNLYTWSLTTPQKDPEFVGVISSNSGLQGLAFSKGKLYASSQNVGLVLVDPFLNTELVIPYTSSRLVGGIASDSSTGIIYGTDDTQYEIVKFDLDNGTIESVVDYPAGEEDIDGLAAGDGK